MAKPISSLESHPQRRRIIEELSKGTPYRDIAKWTNPAVTPMALSRYKGRAVADLMHSVSAATDAIANIDKGVTGKTTEAVTRAALAIAVDPFRARIAQHAATLDGEIAAARGDGKTIAALIGVDLRGLELDAKLAGRLSDVGDKLTVQIVMPAAQSSPADDYDGITLDIKPAK